ncbi:FAD-binding protein [Flavisphingomonas formosensis]|uniref:FAD-binding protein n=1 Tax=Flavisphingomonas formosensis TaxID=861534 RepID=UPI0012FABAC9|nr:FAD-binding protein [Sphingomonas formosensis]
MPITESIGFARDFTRVEDARVVDSESDVAWDAAGDFVVIGYGGAGVAAALQARENGLDVIAIDRFEGGGSTAMNGGIYYAGGGTAIQKAAGVEDSPEAMFEYLEREVQGVVSDETLHRFCDTSVATMDWLMSKGVEFDPTYYPKKTSYPARGIYLYHPDNSLLPAYRGTHPPAARGHKSYLDLGNAAQGFGRALFEPLRDAAAKEGVRVMRFTEARQLILDTAGRVLGLKARHVSPDHPSYQALVNAQRAAAKWLLMLPTAMPGAQVTLAIGKRFARKAAAIEAKAAKEVFIRARQGVCLASGGFIQNQKMLKHYAPRFEKVMPVGSLGDDGSGILLGRSAGGALDRMGTISAWRFLNPPSAWAEGMLVNARGARYVNESSYGATVGEAMMKPENDGVAWLIMDEALWQKARHQLKHDKMLPFQRDPAKLTMMIRSKKAPTIAALGAKLGFDPATFAATAAAYANAAAERAPDAFHKAPADMGKFTSGPFHAIDLGLESPFFPCPSITVGGLKVEESSGLVLREDGSPVPGLYAAGRTAIGICSNLYMSGLSAADCIFAGRRAGNHVAGRDRERQAA